MLRTSLQASTSTERNFLFCTAPLNSIWSQKETLLERERERDSSGRCRLVQSLELLGYGRFVPPGQISPAPALRALSSRP